MRLFSLNATDGHAITQFGSRGVSMLGIYRGDVQVQLGYLRLEAGGVVGKHPAGARQLLMVVTGSGWVAGADGIRRRIAQGEAAYWEPGEEHETTSDGGLAAFVLEGDALDPATWLHEIERDD
jgi:quercetin dioxygenase-like cupin family protein